MNMDTGEFQAITGRLDDLAAEVARLAKHVEQLSTAEQILRRSSYPESMLYGPAKPPRHLRPVKDR